MAVRSGDAPSQRRHKGANNSDATIPQYHQSPPVSGSKDHSNGKMLFKKSFIGSLLPKQGSRGGQTMNSILRSTTTWMILVVFPLFATFWWFMRLNNVSQQVGYNRIYPRNVAIGATPRELASFKSNDVERWRSSEAMPYGEEPMKLDNDAKYDKYQVIPDDVSTGCKFIADWQKQTSARPTCNSLHELGMKMGNPGSENRLEFIDSGRLKEVWRVFGQDDNPKDFVLKTSVYGRKFNDDELYNHKLDALVMTEASSNQFVLDMYSYCAYSSLAEGATGHLGSWLKSYGKRLSGLQKLRIAVMVANGVEGMQLFHGDMPTLVHADIKTQQFLAIEHDDELVFKINDFNRGRMLTSNNPPEICPFYMGSSHKGSTCRSPEEYEKKAPLNDKLDVYSMGSMFYHILTGQDPFKDIDFEDAMENIRTGVEPPLPSSIRNSTDPSIVAILDAMDQCHRFLAEHRPNSKQVATQLRAALKKISSSQPKEDE